MKSISGIIKKEQRLTPGGQSEKGWLTSDLSRLNRSCRPSRAFLTMRSGHWHRTPVTGLQRVVGEGVTTFPENYNRQTEERLNF